MPMSGGTGRSTTPAPTPLAQIDNVYSMSFDGQNYITIDNSQSTLNVANVSVSAWVFPLVGNNFGWIIANGVNNFSGGNFWGLVMRPDVSGKAKVRAQLKLIDNVGNTLYVREDITQGLTIGSWNHVAMSYNGTVLKTYVNGLEETHTISGGFVGGNINYNPSAMNSLGVQISKRGTDNLYFKGDLDEISVFNTALTKEEILSIYNATAVVDGVDKTGDLSQLTTPPVAWYRM